MRIGTTTFGFRYQLQDVQRAPSLPEVLQQTRSCGLECLQICENARPLELPRSAWLDVVRCAADLSLELQVGCLTLSPEVFAKYTELAAAIPCDTVRVVLEEHGRGKPARGEVVRFLDAAVRRLETAGMRLAIENHFDIPCKLLAEIVQAYPATLVGFCIDTANSLRNFEPPAEVVAWLGARVWMYHLKDYEVSGTNVGFSVGGAPLGSGDLDLSAFLANSFDRCPASHVFIENWVPASGDRDTDVRNDREWLLQSLANLRRALETRTVSGRRSN